MQLINYIKKLFGQSQPTTQKEEEQITITKNIIEVTASRSKPEPINDLDETPKDYNIAVIKKQATQIKNKVGNLASCEFIKKVISHNNLEFKELISLLKKLIPYLKKEESIEESEILSYLTSQIDSYSNITQPENISDIADLHHRISNLHAIEYLENLFEHFETNQTRTIAHFESIIHLTDYYLEGKQGDMAFRTTRIAGYLVDYFYHVGKHKNEYPQWESIVNKDYFFKDEYLRMERILNSKRAEICFNGSKRPNYGDYLFFSINEFIIQVAQSIALFPIFSDDFSNEKNNYWKLGWGFQANENFNSALEHLNISANKQDLLYDIFEYSFEELPLKMGITKQYFKEGLADHDRNLTGFEWEQAYTKNKKVKDFGVELAKREFDILWVYDFSRDVLKKYCE